MPHVGCPPTWPRGPLFVLMLGGFMAGSAIAFYPPSRVGPLEWLFQFGTTLFRGEFGLKLVMGLANAAHAVESLFMIKKCRELRLPATHTLGWWGMTLLIGYGAFVGLNQQLSKQAKKSGKAH
mmetsp:Transcript_31236/g.79647  ORF Transcript_31236/g.79647 Transcript_31236/m.79647 type:complete len:123 (+) Transcript_31236:34-402(+)